MGSLEIIQKATEIMKKEEFCINENNFGFGRHGTAE